ncbi:MAG: DNA-3-methyladenine glycosylase [Gloeobacteraceae cyanobacterium ES-bin-316]|nr:DNA-3-methyladenine glycosylase [Ferruginibacter sp.]
MSKLSTKFYDQPDVVNVARLLIGKIVVTTFDDKITSGRIVETEAYVAFTDKASHAFDGKRTARNEHMYAAAGTAYVYICYGMHQMLNVVTNKKEIPDAVLIRALEPLEGIDTMLERTGKPKLDYTLTKGPGNVAKALGIFKKHSGSLLTGKDMYIREDKNNIIFPGQIAVSKRIGIAYAAEDANLPYRFFLMGSKFVSGKKSQ